MRGRRCGKAAMIRWILLDHEIDDSASERKGGRGGGEIAEIRREGVRNNRKVLMKRGVAPRKTKSGV